MSNRPLHDLLLMAGALCLTGALQPALARLALPPLFSDHVVLNRGPQTQVWGRAEPEQAVAVEVAGARAVTHAGRDGRWRVALDLSQCPPGPHELTVSAGAERLQVRDVLIGEVWLASGQSNMEWPLRATEGADEAVATSANPQIRMFTVKKVSATEPKEVAEGAWQVAAPAVTGAWSAVGYHFGRELQLALGQPVGLVHASWGSSPIESWSSLESLLGEPAVESRVRGAVDEIRLFPALRADYAEKFAAWAERHGRKDEPVVSPELLVAAAEPAGSWAAYDPGSLASVSILPAAGTAWFRKRVAVAPESAGLHTWLSLGRMEGFCSVYWRGKLIWEVSPATGQPAGHQVLLSPEQMVAGESILAVRIYNPWQRPRFSSDSHRTLRLGGIPLESDWRAWTERTLPEHEKLPAGAALPRFPTQPPPEQQRPTGLFNGMIAPLVPYSIRGILWYQGEGNRPNARQYRSLFPALIHDWRRRWGQGDIPFYFCQLPNIGAKQPVPATEDSTASLREAQSLALALPQTGQAVLIDLGEEEDIHPRRKREVGQRLALLALARTYGQSVADAGPVYAGCDPEGGAIRVRFANTGSELVARPLPTHYQPRLTASAVRPLLTYNRAGPLEGFTICGSDRRWVRAQARIEGVSVVVWSPEVPAPVAVRYGWESNPTLNLYNAAGLPTAPFRSDDF